jgi:hypothetical protein
VHGSMERWWAIISGTWMWSCWSQTAAATEGLAALAQGIHQPECAASLQHGCPGAALGL